jgi:hypothetical protein
LLFAGAIWLSIDNVPSRRVKWPPRARYCPPGDAGLD